MIRCASTQMNLFYDRKFDVILPEQTYDLKLGFKSSHTAAIGAAKPADTFSIWVVARVSSRRTIGKAVA